MSLKHDPASELLHSSVEWGGNLRAELLSLAFRGLQLPSADRKRETVKV